MSQSFLAENDRSERFIKRMITFGVLALALIVGSLMSLYEVDAGYRGVVLRNGAVHSVAEPGLHAKLPFFDEVVHMSVRTQLASYSGVQTYSRDIQQASMLVSVNYRVDPLHVAQVYASLGTNYVVRVITPIINKRAEEVFSQYNAVNIVAGRQQIGIQYETAVRNSVQDRGLIIESVQLENIDFTDAYEGAIEEAMKAEATVKRTYQELESKKIDADKVRVAAQAEADAVVFAATAEANAIKLRGNAEAEAITARARALGDNPLLVELTLAEKWGGILPTTMVPGGGVPLLNITK